MNRQNINLLSISCKNSQGGELNASVLRMERYTVVFEVYNPYSIVQTSEVLEDFRIFSEDRVLYSGKAIVSSIVNTGIFLVCEASLGDSWQELDFLNLIRGDKIGSKLTEFLGDWQKSNQVIDPFKISVTNCENTLLGLSKWLEEVDFGLRSTLAGDRIELERKVIDDLGEQIDEKLMVVMEDLEKKAGEVDPEVASTHKAYVRRLTHPFLMKSPFCYRTFVKPLGYAGDYEMVNMILKNGYNGANLFAKLLDHTFLKLPAAEAHRNRIKYLVKLLLREGEKAAREGRRLKVLNLGCGPAMEIQHVLDDDCAEFIDFDLLDFSQETIDYTESVLRKRLRQGSKCNINFILKSVHQLLKEASRSRIDRKYDIIYCAGLFDYLSQKVCAKLVSMFCDMVHKEGIVVVTNVAKNNPTINLMEYLVEWNLIYRDDNDMKDLTPKGNIASEVVHDETGVNLFLELTHTDRS